LTETEKQKKTGYAGLLCCQLENTGIPCLNREYFWRMRSKFREKMVIIQL